MDARLVKSASRPVSNKEIDELKNKHETPEGKLDKKGKPKKFTRDLESNWTIKRGKQIFKCLAWRTSLTNEPTVFCTAPPPGLQSPVPAISSNGLYLYIYADSEDK